MVPIEPPLRPPWRPLGFLWDYLGIPRVLLGGPRVPGTPLGSRWEALRWMPLGAIGNSVGAPTEFNVDLGFLIMRRFWIGASYRSAIEAIIGQTSSHDSVDFWLGMRFKNGFRFGLAYDYHLTSLQGPGYGSYEVMLGYDLNKSKEPEDGGNIIDPRYLTF